MDLRCSAWARSEAVDPIGTAGSYAGFVGIEWRRPWPRGLNEVDALAPVAADAARRGLRLQGLLPVDRAEAAHVILYQAPEPASSSGDGFGAYLRAEVSCAPEDVVAGAQDLFAGDGPPLAPAPPASDVLVCTHGRRDVCCGSRGTGLLAELGGGDALGPDVQLWATSHTGGHRFAPTAIVLPEGTMWAFLEPDILRRIVHRHGPVDELLAHYRGCAGLGSPALQALERAVLAEMGWALFDCVRRGTDVGDGCVQLAVSAPDGTVRTWEAEVVVQRLLPVPECGQPVAGAKKHEPELAVTGLRELD